MDAKSLRALLASTKAQAIHQEREGLILLAKPLYIEMLCSLPFYEARRHDDQFWSAYVGSRVTKARRLVERSQIASKQHAS